MHIHVLFRLEVDGLSDLLNLLWILSFQLLNFLDTRLESLYEHVTIVSHLNDLWLKLSLLSWWGTLLGNRSRRSLHWLLRHLDNVRETGLHTANVGLELVFVFQFANPLLIVDFSPLDFSFKFVHFFGFCGVSTSIFVDGTHTFLLLAHGPDPLLELLISVVEVTLQLLNTELQLLLPVCPSGLNWFRLL